MKEQQLERLLKGYIAGEITAEEYREKALVNSFDSDFTLFQLALMKKLFLSNTGSFIAFGEEDFEDFCHKYFDNTRGKKVVSSVINDILLFIPRKRRKNTEVETELRKLKNVLPLFLSLYVASVQDNGFRGMGFKSVCFLKDMLFLYYPKYISSIKISDKLPFSKSELHILKTTENFAAIV